ncbi:T9SS type A sorting domain-containing protein [Fulvivirga maritima]|uniref:T9SS type A sorting domain-containing protein n=1 Tax=Fulvivirga maritima TaxID=2904247 RepID=UPI001F28C4D5|nr:T9SS type A sorting domain-containing protein [Fulvivirga maritima]UII24547.1 T9SS type A sorting domain-containing protein [Fulvivirga maritima]
MKNLITKTILQMLFTLICTLSYGQISLVKDQFPGGFYPGIYEEDYKFAKTDEAVFISGGSYILRTDGTESGTDIMENTSTYEFFSLGDYLYYRDDIDSYDVYRSDGSPYSSSIFHSYDSDSVFTMWGLAASEDIAVAGIIDDGENYVSVIYPDGHVKDFDNFMYLSIPYVIGDEVYYKGYTDSTLYGIYRVKDEELKLLGYTPEKLSFYEPFVVAEIGDETYSLIVSDKGFYYSEGQYTELWKMNEDDIELVFTFPDNLIIGDYVSVGDFTFFTFYDRSDYYGPILSEVWISDGTAEGTKKFMDGLPDLIGGENKLFGSDDDGFWSYDVLTKEWDYFDPVGLAQFDLNHQYGDQIYYWKDNGQKVELWTTDGTTEGTKMIFKNNSNLLVYGPSEVHDGMVLFVAEHYPYAPDEYDPDLDYGAEIYRYLMGVSRVMSFAQGTKNNGGKVPAERSDANNVLANPQENNEYNFVALGFGGSITLELASKVWDDGSANADMILVETSYGRADQYCYSDGGSNYPEQAFVEVSEDGISWYSLPNLYCRTSFIDIKPAVDQGMEYAQYIRITDASNSSLFPPSADGYDVDGIIINREVVNIATQEFTNSRLAGNPMAAGFNPDFFNTIPNEEFGPKSIGNGELSVYPNPSPGGLLSLNMQFDEAYKGTIRVMDITGKEKYRRIASFQEGANQLELDMSDLPKGTYILELEAGSKHQTSKIIIQ